MITLIAFGHGWPGVYFYVYFYVKIIIVLSQPYNLRSIGVHHYLVDVKIRKQD